MAVNSRSRKKKVSKTGRNPDSAKPTSDPATIDLSDRLKSERFELACVLSGFATLTLQVGWQRYLSFLVGSDHLAAALVVGIFLLSLGAGYGFWGKWGGQQVSRRTLIRTAAWCELGIGIFAAFFPLWFDVLKFVGQTLPESLLVSFVQVILAVGPGGFLMGASVPLLSRALSDGEGVSRVNWRTYGLISLGAGLGSFAAVLVVVPLLGITGAMILASLVGVGVCLLFLSISEFGLRDLIKRPGTDSQVEGAADFKPPTLAFLSGAIALALEMVFLRWMNLTIGPMAINFPLILGISVVGIGVGSLTLGPANQSESSLAHQILKLILGLIVLSFILPAVPSWAARIRVSMSVTNFGFFSFLFLFSILSSILLGPIFFWTGRILPMSVGLGELRGASSHGLLYAVNSVGSFVGAVMLGNLMLRWLSFTQVFHIVLGITFGLFIWTHPFTTRNWRKLTVVGLGTLLSFGIGWSREPLLLGLFQKRVLPEDSAPLFRYAKFGPEVRVLSDREDPIAAVTVLELSNSDGKPNSRSLLINGKSDGNTAGDFSTMVLSAVVPYSFAPAHEGIRAAAIGMGLGVTSGVLTQLPNVSTVETIEISPRVIEAVSYFKEFNFNLAGEKRSKLVEMDAFRYLSQGSRRFELITSEPSNPWVAGNERLFTEEFFEAIAKNLTDDGIFFQWVPAYSMNDRIFLTIAANLRPHFSEMRVFQIGRSDLGILAARRPFKSLAVPGQPVQLDPNSQKILHSVGMGHWGQVQWIERISERGLQKLLEKGDYMTHSMRRPGIAGEATLAHYKNSFVSLNGKFSVDEWRAAANSEEQAAERELIWEQSHQFRPNCSQEGSQPFFCARYFEILADRELLKLEAPEKIIDGVQAYGRLRATNQIRARVDWLMMKGEKSLSCALGGDGIALAGLGQDLISQQCLVGLVMVTDELNREGVPARAQLLAQKLLRRTGWTNEEVKVRASAALEKIGK